MKRFKLILWAVVGLIVVSFFGSIALYLPSTVKVRLAGTEIKRSDVAIEGGGTEARDVRYILAKDVESGDALVFRNEDTRWGFPPYFKFKSADLAAWATDVSQKQPDAIVLLTYYGTRNSALDIFPNVVSMKIVDATYSHLPLFNIIFWILFAAALVFVFVRLRRLKRRFSDWRRGKRGSEPHERDPGEPVGQQ